MRAIGRSASRGLGPARQTETTPVAVVMAWDCIDGPQPQSIIGARNLVVVATWWMLREIDAAGSLMNCRHWRQRRYEDQVRTPGK